MRKVITQWRGVPCYVFSFLSASVMQGRGLGSQKDKQNQQNQVPLQFYPLAGPAAVTVDRDPISEGGGSQLEIPGSLKLRMP